MRMKNRFSKMAKSLLYAMCFVSICGVSYSCTDDYDLDEKAPSFLKGSIYDELKTRTDRKFQTLVRLIDDLNYAEVLAKTGSKTIFAADDEAFEVFFRTNNWKDINNNPIRSYEQLSENQKKILLKGSMLDNAYVLEMMANVTLNNTLNKNQCLRQISSAAALDSIPYWKYNELPQLLNEGDTVPNSGVVSDLQWWNGVDFWGRRNTQAAGGLYMAVDGTNPMLTHFLEGQMKEKNLLHSDITFILNDKNPWPEDAEKRDYIYNRRIVEADNTCMNGYYHVLDSVLVTPSNMAEMIRQNPKTTYFAAMLDRFSAPYYNSQLTYNYKAMHNIGDDSVFVKRYVSNNGSAGRLTIDPDGKSLDNTFPALAYDPGWNQYAVSATTAKEQDMAAMFVPTNQALYTYFTEGGGRILMERFAKDATINESNFLKNLYQIPLDIMRSLINNLMKSSFIESVPSKWKTIMNDAQDQMFPPAQYTDETYRALFDEVMLANNGVVYVMNQVISPADFASVIAPALYSRNTQVMKSLVQADDNFIDGSNAFANAPLQKYYSTYLKAMQSHFSFFVPTDEAMKSYGVVDPFMYSAGATLQGRWRYWSFEYVRPTGQNATTAVAKMIPIQARAYRWNASQGRNSAVDAAAQGIAIVRPTQATNDRSWGEVRKFLLTDLVDQHIVVHKGNEADGVASAPDWYLSRNGAPVYVKRKVNGITGVGMVVNGGLQLMLNGDDVEENNEDCNVIEGYDQTGIDRVTGAESYGNGITYLIDRPMQPTLKSVYNVMRSNSEYSDFLNLCNEVSISLLRRAGFDRLKKDSVMSDVDWAKESAKYLIFRPSSSNFFTPANEPLVRFFNNYNYTIYVPKNSAIQDAINNYGLPTWETIEQFITTNIESIEVPILPSDPTPEEQAKYDEAIDKRWEAQQKAMAMCTTLMNFLKYHFQDRSLFVDHVNATGEYQTSCIDNSTNAYIMLNTTQTDGALSIKDNQGNVVNVEAPYNQLANDMQFDKAVGSYSTPGHVKICSYAVLHTIDNYLNFVKPADWTGRFDGAWSSATRAKNFVKKYRIRK